MDSIKSISTDTVDDVMKIAKVDRLSVEFFHIYTDESINGRHTRGLEYLKTIEKTWTFPYDRIVLIDDYNPTKQTLVAEDILNYLKDHNMLPEHWAYEKDLLPHAKELLSLITSPRLKKNYENYVQKNNKYPCSLLIATWYLTRLGRFESSNIIKATSKAPSSSYEPAGRLLNILPQDYKNIEKRALSIIRKSKFAQDVDRIQDLFYPTESNQLLDLF